MKIQIKKRKSGKQLVLLVILVFFSTSILMAQNKRQEPRNENIGEWLDSIPDEVLILKINTGEYLGLDQIHRDGLNDLEIFSRTSLLTHHNEASGEDIFMSPYDFADKVISYWNHDPYEPRIRFLLDNQQIWEGSLGDLYRKFTSDFKGRLMPVGWSSATEFMFEVVGGGLRSNEGIWIMNLISMTGRELPLEENYAMTPILSPNGHHFLYGINWEDNDPVHGGVNEFKIFELKTNTSKSLKGISPKGWTLPPDYLKELNTLEKASESLRFSSGQKNQRLFSAIEQGCSIEGAPLFELPWPSGISYCVDRDGPVPFNDHCPTTPKYDDNGNQINSNWVTPSSQSSTGYYCDRSGQSYTACLNLNIGPGTLGSCNACASVTCGHTRPAIDFGAGLRISPVLAGACGYAFKDYERNGAGHFVRIFHPLPNGDFCQSLYMHLKEGSIPLDFPNYDEFLPDIPNPTTGKWVSVGSEIGIEGKTGGNYSEHIHFELRSKNDNESYFPQFNDGVGGEYTPRTGYSYVSNNSNSLGCINCNDEFEANNNTINNVNIQGIHPDLIPIGGPASHFQIINACMSHDGSDPVDFYKLHLAEWGALSIGYEGFGNTYNIELVDVNNTLVPWTNIISAGFTYCLGAEDEYIYIKITKDDVANPNEEKYKLVLSWSYNFNCYYGSSLWGHIINTVIPKAHAGEAAESEHICEDSNDQPTTNSILSQTPTWALNDNSLQSQVQGIISYVTDIDAFWVDANGQTGDVELSLVNLPQNYEMKVERVNANWNWVEGQTSTNEDTNNEHLTTTIQPGDIGVIISVWPKGYWNNYPNLLFGETYDCSPYTLKIDWSGTNNPECNDSSEPNTQSNPIEHPNFTPLTATPSTQSFTSIIENSEDIDGWRTSILGSGSGHVYLKNLSSNLTAEVKSLPSWTVLGYSATSGTADEHVQFISVSGDTELLIVIYEGGFGTSGPTSVCSEYDVEVVWDPESCLQSYEPNNTLATAYGLPTLSEVGQNAESVTINTRIHDNNDIDVWKSDVEQGYREGTIDVQLTNLSANFQLELKGYPSGQLIDYSLNLGTSNEHVQGVLPSGDNSFRIIVYGEGYWSETSSGEHLGVYSCDPYFLNVSWTPPTPPQECNDNPELPDYNGSLYVPNGFVGGSFPVEVSMQSVIKSPTDLDVLFFDTNGKRGVALVEIDIPTHPNGTPKADYDFGIRRLNENWSWVSQKDSYDGSPLAEEMQVGDQGLVIAVWPKDYWSGGIPGNYTCDQYTITVSWAPLADGNSPCDAISLEVNSTCQFQTFSTIGAQGISNNIAQPGDANMPQCLTASGSMNDGGTPKHARWFTYTQPNSGNSTITLANAPGHNSFDGVAAVYLPLPDCNTLWLTQCSDSDPNGNGVMPYFHLNYGAGSQIYLAVWEYGNDHNGDFKICIEEGSESNRIAQPTPDISIYPNPTQNIVYVKATRPLSNLESLEITSIDGRLVQKWDAKLYENKQEFTLQLNSNVISGMYLLRLRTKETVAIKRLSILD